METWQKSSLTSARWNKARNLSALVLKITVTYSSGFKYNMANYILNPLQSRVYVWIQLDYLSLLCAGVQFLEKKTLYLPHTKWGVKCVRCHYYLQLIHW